MNPQGMQRLSAASVRRLLDRVVLSDAELQALCIDHFPWVSTQLGSGMTRVEKVNTLLQLCADDLDSIVRALGEMYPERIARPGVRSAGRERADVGWAPQKERRVQPEATRLRFYRGVRNAALSCDRSEQWQAMLQIAQRTGVEVALLPGPQGEAHEFFIERVRDALPRQLRTTLPIHVCSVDWPGGRCPTLFRDAVTALAQSLQCHPSIQDVQAALRHWMNESILVLTHPVFQPAFDSTDEIIRYYVEWLPELFLDVWPGAACKLVQPIEWVATSWLSQSLALLLPRQLRWVQRALSPGVARRLIAALVQKQSERLSILSMAPLRPIEGHHVREFLERIRFPAEPAGRKDLIRGVQQSCLRSDDILRCLAQRVPEEPPGADAQEPMGRAGHPTLLPNGEIET